MNSDECTRLTERVLAAVFEVSNTLGAGFLRDGPSSLAVIYKGHSVGEYFADILVENVLVVELKRADRPANEQTAQSLNYLRASGVPSVFSSISRGPKPSGSVS